MSTHPIGGPYEDRGNPIKTMLRPRRRSARYGPLVRAYVGLGANLGDREATIRRAVALVDELAGVAVVGVSSLRETEPWGPVEQPRYLNGAVAVETDLPPRELLDALLEIERRLGRARDDHERRFALEPLAELAPDAFVPGRGTAAELLRALDTPPQGTGSRADVVH